MKHEQPVLAIPSTGQQVFTGQLVTLARYPNTKWVTHYGTFVYNGATHTGWYVKSIPSQTIIPLTDEDLLTMSVVGAIPPHCPPFPHSHMHGPRPGMHHPPFPPEEDFGGHCCPVPKPPKDNPPDCGCECCHPDDDEPTVVPDVKEFTAQDKEDLDNAFLTVKNLAELEELKTRSEISPGKMVRVNGESPEEATYWYYDANIGNFREVEFVLKDDLEDMQQEMSQLHASLAWGTI